MIFKDIAAGGLSSSFLIWTFTNRKIKPVEIQMLLNRLCNKVIGNLWNIELWQLFCLLGFSMLALGWVFYRLGWLKG